MPRIRRLCSASILWLLAIVIIPDCLSAKESHIEGLKGDDAADGTWEHPWKTIGRATTAVGAGDVIVIHSGTYKLDEQLAFNKSGTAGQPILVTANQGERVLIDGGSGPCVTLQARSYICFRGLSFTTASTLVGAHMVYMEATNVCSFENCEFYGMPAPVGSENSSVIRCMATENGFSTGCIFRNNLFVDNRSPALRLYTTDGWIIENNEFRNCAQAVGGKDTPRNMLVRRNLIIGGDPAFLFSGQHGCKNVTITENIVIGADTCFQIGGLGTEGKVRGDLWLFNNTFFGCAQFINGWDDEFTRGQCYYNNIFFDVTSRNVSSGADIAGRIINFNKYGDQPVRASDFFMDWNCLSIPPDDTSIRFIDARIRSQSIPEWTAAHPPFEAHSICADPMFVDPKNHDFHLQSESPCKRRGMDGADMGAYPNETDKFIIGRISSE